MILIITSSARGQECVDALNAATGENTEWAHDLQDAASHLREKNYSVAVVDQFLADSEPEESDQALEHLGTTFPVYVNFGIASMQRLVRDVRLALHRRQREEKSARRVVQQQMLSDMREVLTAMLLSCDLALSCPEMPAAAVSKVRAIDALTRDLRARLEAV